MSRRWTTYRNTAWWLLSWTHIEKGSVHSCPLNWKGEFRDTLRPLVPSWGGIQVPQYMVISTSVIAIVKTAPILNRFCQDEKNFLCMSWRVPRWLRVEKLYYLQTLNTGTFENKVYSRGPHKAHQVVKGLFYYLWLSFKFNLGNSCFALTYTHIQHGVNPRINIAGVNTDGLLVGGGGVQRATK